MADGAEQRIAHLSFSTDRVSVVVTLAGDRITSTYAEESQPAVRKRLDGGLDYAVDVFHRLCDRASGAGEPPPEAPEDRTSARQAARYADLVDQVGRAGLEWPGGRYNTRVDRVSKSESGGRFKWLLKPIRAGGKPHPPVGSNLPLAEVCRGGCQLVWDESAGVWLFQ